MSTTRTFLEYVAEDMISKWGTNMSRIVVVFPNKRAALFLNEYLARIAGKPMWSPAYTTISELFGKYYGYVQINDSMSFAQMLLEYADVAVVPGSAFCSEGFCRLSYATSLENIQRGLVRIAAFVDAMTDEPQELITDLPQDQHE